MLLRGVIWGVLHAPLFFMKGGHPGGWPPLLFLAMTVAWSVLFALAYEGTGGSILIVHLLHQALNGWSDALPIYPRVAHSSAPAAIFVVLAAAIAVAAVRRAGWRWSGESGRAARAARAAGASARPGAPLPDRPI